MVEGKVSRRREDLEHIAPVVIPEPLEPSEIYVYSNDAVLDQDEAVPDE